MTTFNSNILIYKEAIK